MGLRERKKQQTRQAISDVATRLFIARGFDHVTVAEVAEAAGVSVNTIFNYFTTKEELFFDRADAIQEELDRLVRERRVGESVIEALHRRCTEMITSHDRIFAGARVRPFFATIERSPALRLRERLLREQSEQRLAARLAEETGAKPDDVTARVVAAQVIGVQWLLMQEFRARLLRGQSAATIRTALLRLTDRAFALLRDGAGDYGRRTK